MASLEKRAGGYRVVFRYAGRKYSRSLLTTQLTAARASVARLEDNLRRLELGLLSPPAGAELCDFLLADGKTLEVPKASAIPTLSPLCDYYFEQLPLDALEASTLYGMRIHVRHLNRILGSYLATNAITADKLQDYINKR